MCYPITANQFWNDFVALWSNDAFLNKAKEKWHNTDRQTGFTPFIIPHIKKILENCGLTAMTEYYKIDVIGYRDEKTSIPCPAIVEPHFWWLDAAIEHENACGKWTDELAKLLFINCPLRVVIGYYEEGQDIAPALQYAASVITRANAEAPLPCVPGSHEYLLILGESIKDTSRLSAAVYTPYIFINGTFQELE